MTIGAMMIMFAIVAIAGAMAWSINRRRYIVSVGDSTEKVEERR